MRSALEGFLSVTWRLRISLIWCEELIMVNNRGDYCVDGDRWSETATAAETCHQMTFLTDGFDKPFA